MIFRKAWFSFFTLLIACPAAFAQDLDVLPDPFEGGPPKEMTTRYLRNLARQAVEKRRLTFEGLKDAKDILAYQQRMRQQFVEKLGGFPEKSPLNAKIVGTIKGDGYRVENVIFESRPQHYVTANFYIPDGQGPHPGAILSCGHSNLPGKASGAYQLAGILAAKHGIAVLCYDPIGQGERFQMLNADGTPRYRLSTSEHSHVGVSCILVGKNAATYRIWDGMRALDYLETRPDIIKGKYGCTGISGGGTLTEYLMALDDRIFCAAPGCAPSHFAHRVDKGGMGDAEQNIFGQIAWGLDHPDFAIMRAPKPTLILAASEDFVDINGTWDLFREASRVYAKLGHPERMALVETDAKHGYSKGLREGMAAWMRRWLLGIDGNVIEANIKPHPVAELRCSPKGQVQLLPGARTVMDFNMDLVEKFAPARKELWRLENRAKALADVRSIAGIRALASLQKPSPRRIGKIERPGYTIEKIILDSGPGIWLPALHFQPAKATAPRILYVHGSGKATDAKPGGPIEKLVLQGHPVLAPDIRSCGEIGPQPAKEWGGSFYEIFMAYKLGKSFVGMRAEDILVCARFLSEADAKAPAPVHLIAVAEAGPAALHAATVEKQLFAHLTLRDSMTTWVPTVRDPTSPGQLVQTVHGALQAYDLADLLASLPKESVTVEALVQEKKEAKADDEKTQRNRALNLAAALGQLEKVKELLKQGADIQWRDPADNGKTPLVKAILGERFETVKYLLENGADIHYPDGSGRYPIRFCCISTNVDMVQYLLAKGGAKDVNRGPLNLLVSVCDHGQATPELIPIFIKAGANPDVYQGTVTPLIAAIKLDPKVRKLEIARSYVKALIECKADVNLKDKKGMSPLQWANQRGDQVIIEMLKKAGAKE